jgi:hypothetical protein
MERSDIFFVSAGAAGDWLQGPYVYALYQHYGFDRGDIGRLFIAGFGSSMIFGTIVGSLADKTCALDSTLRGHIAFCHPCTPYAGF